MAIFVSFFKWKVQYNLRSLVTNSAISSSKNTRALGLHIAVALLFSLAFAFLSVTLYRWAVAGSIIKSFLTVFLLVAAIIHTHLFFKQMPLRSSGWPRSLSFFSLLAFVVGSVLFLIFLWFQKDLLLLSIDGLLFLLPVLLLKTWHAFDNISESRYPIYKLERLEERDAKVYLNTLSIGIKVLISGPELYEKTFFIDLPDQLPFGHLFSTFIQYNDYEIDEDFVGQFDEEPNMYGWVFYKNSFFGLIRKNLDPHLSLSENEVDDNAVIIAKRVKEINSVGDII
jgi:hypothetical protein